MTMMGGPIDARKSPTGVNNLATTKSHSWFENNVIYRVPSNFPGAGRRVYPGFLQHTGFVAMNPKNHAKSHYDYFKDLVKGDDASAEAHRKFYDEYNAVLDMDASYYLETIRVVFQDFSLVSGTWDVRNVQGKIERVRPADIKTTALMSVEGELDDISGTGQTQAVHEVCTGVPENLQKHFEAKGAGHYGIFSGKRWREHVYPQVKAFIKANHPGATTPVADPAPKAPAAVMDSPLPESAAVAPIAAAVEVKVAAKKPVNVVKVAIAPVEPAQAASKTVATKRAVSKK
jgi:poly(3-hydroxybutyrate) depolymerase